MGRYVASRIIGMIPTVILLVAAVVGLTRLIPGDVVDLMLLDNRADDATRAEMRAKLSLDEPFLVTTTEYLAGILRGDLGQSLWNERSVVDIMQAPLIVSAELGLLALVVGVTGGLSIGIIAALKQDSGLDYLLRGSAIAFLSVPAFVTATALVVLPAIYFGWTPPIFFIPFSQDPLGHIGVLLLPAIIVGLDNSASIMRLTRTMMLEVLRQDYMRTAYAKGLSPSTVVLKHGLRNAMIPVVTIIGLQVANLISSSVVVETVFGLPGLGRLLLTAVQQRDYPIVQGITVTVGIGIMFINLLVDISYGWLDPRIRLS